MSVAGRGRDLWVVIPRRGQVLRLDAASGRVEGWITPPQTPVDVELGDDGAVWVTARRPMNPYDPLRPHDLVLRYDRGGTERARISVPLEVADIAPARDGIWGLRLTSTQIPSRAGAMSATSSGTEMRARSVPPRS